MRGILAVAAVLSALTGVVAAQTGTGEIVVTFEESAPKDRFSIRNVGGCDLGPVVLTIDLNGAAGGLIFDTTAAGAGVDVYQPFELTTGAGFVDATARVTDGDRAVRLQLNGFPTGAAVAFTIDVDDTLPVSEIGQTRVSGSEIAGAKVTVEPPKGVIGEQITIPFGPDARATMDAPFCGPIS